MTISHALKITNTSELHSRSSRKVGEGLFKWWCNSAGGLTNYYGWLKGGKGCPKWPKKWWRNMWMIPYNKALFSFHNVLFYFQPVYFFHLLRDFCKFHGHIVAFFLFLFYKNFDYIYDLFCIIYFLDKF